MIHTYIPFKNRLQRLFDPCKEMVLEASVIIVDNSEWTRNGDYSPSRLEAAKETSNFMASRKLIDNVENCVGVMTMGGLNGKCLLSLTSEAGKIASAIGLIQYEDGCNFESSIKIAQIVLKHRQNTNQKQRIIAFLASPLPSHVTKESLTELGIKMKKNGIAIDIIDFGTENRGNTEILTSLIDSCDSEAHQSHLITIESSLNTNNTGTSTSNSFLLDTLRMKAPELFNMTTSNSHEGATDGFEFDPEMDPELAMALKLSMEEEVNRQKQQQEGEGTSSNNQMMINDDIEDSTPEEDDELMLARAVALSLEKDEDEQSTKDQN